METKNDDENNKIPGEEFLLKKDQKHLDLLAELNQKIEKYSNTYMDYKETIHGSKEEYVNCKQKYDNDNKRKRKSSYKSKDEACKDIAKFISKHYRTFIARLQDGVEQLLITDLFKKNTDGTFKYKDAQSFLKEAKNRGLIFASCRKKFSYDCLYLVDPYDENNKTLKKIKDDFTTCENAFDMQNISVLAHSLGNFSSTCDTQIPYSNKPRQLTLIPFNDNFGSFISARQTAAVENCCKVVNFFTEAKQEENNKNSKEEKMVVTLNGASQGVDFITKMVGSTHRRDQTRIKNADINLVINAPHLFQDEQVIVNRLISGDKNNNTITNISIYNDMCKCVHPTCKTDNLIEWLKYYKRNFNNNVGINDLRTLGSNQQNTIN